MGMSIERMIARRNQMQQEIQELNKEIEERQTKGIDHDRVKELRETIEEKIALRKVMKESKKLVDEKRKQLIDSIHETQDEIDDLVDELEKTFDYNDFPEWLWELREKSYYNP